MQQKETIHKIITNSCRQHNLSQRQAKNWCKKIGIRGGGGGGVDCPCTRSLFTIGLLCMGPLSGVSNHLPLGMQKL